MSVRRGAPKQQLRELGLYSLCLAILFCYLGISAPTALLASVTWIALAAAGGFIVESMVGSISPQVRVLVALGPGALLAVGVSVFVFLSVDGGVNGIAVIVSLILLSAYSWTHSHQVEMPKGKRVSQAPLLLLGVALFANSREYPNLLGTSLVMLAAGLFFGKPRGTLPRICFGAVVLLVMVRDLITRPEFWWWSSDDTTTLAGIGTMVIERGRVDDVAGWSTGSHHWLLHAWLALWNLLSQGHIFETYQVLWPVVASLSLFASLALCIQLFFERELTQPIFVIAAVALAGYAQLEWAAPQEQQPFVFGMFACCGLWLNSRTQLDKVPARIFMLRIAVALILVPVMFYVLKPTLLVAYGLLGVGAMLVRFQLHSGYRWLLSIAASVAATAAGITALSLGSSRISQNSFTSMSIEFLPPDLGWCRINSVSHSSLCVVSLQAPLFVAAISAVLGFWTFRQSLSMRIPLVLFLPLIVAYLPFRLFVSSAVFTGAPSFYRLSEMTLMAVVALGIAGALLVASEKRNVNALSVSFLISLLAVVVWMSRSPSDIYDVVDTLIVRFAPTRYLNASDAIALLLILFFGLVVGRMNWLAGLQKSSLTVILLLSAFLPAARMIDRSLTTENESIRQTRPSFLGPSDIEDVGNWLRKNTEESSLLATNFLCPDDRIGECSASTSQKLCVRDEPALMASWALTAISGREFLYLSQFWDNETNYYFLHQLSTNLGSQLSSESISGLRDAGVTHYVASKAHTNAKVWQRMQRISSFASRNFVVVSLRDVSLGHS